MLLSKQINRKIWFMWVDYMPTHLPLSLMYTAHSLYHAMALASISWGFNALLSSRVNKPYLPIAAGDLSVQSAWLLVMLFAVVGLMIVATNFGGFITSLYCLGLFLGTIYSVPPLRMKQFPVAAFLIIATVWQLQSILHLTPEVVTWWHNLLVHSESFWINSLSHSELKYSNIPACLTSLKYNHGLQQKTEPYTDLSYRYVAFFLILVYIMPLELL